MSKPEMTWKQYEENVWKTKLGGGLTLTVFQNETGWRCALGGSLAASELPDVTDAEAAKYFALEWVMVVTRDWNAAADQLIGGEDVDHWIDNFCNKNLYARWVLHGMRLPAALQLAFAAFLEKDRLYCTWEGKRYVVTGASRRGDIMLHSDLGKVRGTGYEQRVPVAECSSWGPQP